MLRGRIFFRRRFMTACPVHMQITQAKRKERGFIFQFYNLVPNLTVRENIQVCEP